MDDISNTIIERITKMETNQTHMATKTHLEELRNDLINHIDEGRKHHEEEHKLVSISVQHLRDEILQLKSQVRLLGFVIMGGVPIIAVIVDFALRALTGPA